MPRFTKFLIVLLLIITLSLTSMAYYQRMAAFGCFDQCFNFVAGYFMLKGKTLYSQIFFNHQPLMAYLSYLIQAILQPNALYHLVLYHRMFILLFSFLMDILLILRFRWAGIGFVMFYEATKYYLFGNFFLPEAIIAYFFAYLIGLWWEKFQKRHLALTDYLIAGLFTWLIIFLRLPYLPAALILYTFILLPLNPKNKKSTLLSFSLFLLLSLFALLSVPLKDYLEDVFVVNYGLISTETKALGINGLGILKIFLYPFLILFTGRWNYFRSILIGLDIIFLTLITTVSSRIPKESAPLRRRRSSNTGVRSRLSLRAGGGFIFWRILKFKKLKELKEVLLIIFILGLAAIRPVEPGTVFYEAFHMLAWYSLFLMTIFLLLVELLRNKDNRIMAYIFSSLLLVLFIWIIFSPQSFIWEKVNREEEFTVNYVHYFTHGEVIKILSKPADTLFVDLWDELIYWQSGLDSPYQYSLCMPVMSGFEKFDRARLEMFADNPPDFYYVYSAATKDCLALLPDDKKDDYLQFYSAGKPSCLYLKKTKLKEITNEQWEKVKKLGFWLPEMID